VIDRFWQTTVEFLREHCRGSDTVILPDGMEGALCQTVRYRDFREDASFDFFVLHKGMLAFFSSRFIERLVRDSGLYFANEVFLVFCRRPLVAYPDPRGLEGCVETLEEACTHGPEPREEAIFLTGRFRNGTTVLWNIFNAQDGYTAYYEPLNDCLIHGIRHTPPMESHRGVASYWDAYKPIQEVLPKYHQREFAFQRLVLEKGEKHEALEAYLDFLIDRTRRSRAVLQFNRVDLRLPWLRETYPKAKIVHIFRDPRNAWVSSRRHLPEEEWDNPYHPDAYDLFQWIVALRRDFPFLASAKNAYEAHYYLSRLSRIMGDRMADCSIDFDKEIMTCTDTALGRLVENGCLDPENVPRARTVIESIEEQPWSRFRSDAWFTDIETGCDAVLNESGLVEGLGRLSLERIRDRHQAAWEAFDHPDEDRLMDVLMETTSAHRSEITRLLGIIREHEEPAGFQQKAS